MGWEYTRLHALTGETIRLHRVGEWWYVAINKREIARSHFYPDMYRVYNRVERNGIL